MTLTCALSRDFTFDVLCVSLSLDSGMSRVVSRDLPLFAGLDHVEMWLYDHTESTLSCPLTVFVVACGPMVG